MTGKEVWDRLAELDAEKDALLSKAKPDELRRALSHGLDRPSSRDAAHRAMIRRTMCRRGVPIPELLK